MARNESVTRHNSGSKNQTNGQRKTPKLADIPEKAETPLEKALRLSDDQVLAKAIQDLIRKDELN